MNECEAGCRGAWVNVSERWVKKENTGLFCSSVAWNNDNKLKMLKSRHWNMNTHVCVLQACKHTYSMQGNFRARKSEEFIFCPLECCGHKDMWILSGWAVYSGDLSRERGELGTDWRNGPDHLNSPSDLLVSPKSYPSYRKIQCHCVRANLERLKNRPQALPASR